MLKNELNPKMFKIDIDKEVQEVVTSCTAMLAAAAIALISQDTGLQTLALTGILGLGGYKAYRINHEGKK